MENLYTPNSVRTFTGKYLDFTNIRESDICIEDIAKGLANKIRFGGHMLSGSLTVAQHSVWCSVNISNEYALSALLHDASEAYMSDVPGPLKRLLPEYKKIELELMNKVYSKFNISNGFDDAVKICDLSALETEWYNGCINNFMKDDICSIEKSEIMFLERYYNLIGNNTDTF